MTAITIFASSLFTAIALIAVKAIELKFGKVNIILRLIGKLDSLADRAVQSIRFRAYQLVQTVRYLFQVKIKEVANDMSFRAKEWLITQYKLRESRIMGQKEILNKGAVSFYLKKIADDQGSGNKGKIE